MICNRIKNVFLSLENPKHPLLGPNIKGLLFGGLWLKGPKLWIFQSYAIIIFATFFIVTLFIEAYILRKNSNRLLQNLSLSMISLLCYLKCITFMYGNEKWSDLFHRISKEELTAIGSGDKKIIKLINDYTKYSRLLTYFYWFLIFVTNIVMMITPVFNLLTSSNYRKEIHLGNIPYPEIVSSWFPFDKTRMPWYILACVIHVVMASKGSTIIAVFDTNAFVIMVFLKGQMIILREKCEDIFEGCQSRDDVFLKIKECHRHHNFIIRTHKSLNELLSPSMLLYVLICAITICFSVVQYVSAEATFSHKLWVVQYASAQVSQLFFYCWYSNDVFVESKLISDGVYFSEWWSSDKQIRKQILLLAGKLNQQLIFNAGPYTTLTISTFIDIIKGAYSFFTLFSEML